MPHTQRVLLFLPLPLILPFHYDKIQEYDSISRIDNWLTQQLLHIKKSIDAGPDTA